MLQGGSSSNAICWVDLDLRSSPVLWAATIATFCPNPNRIVEHLKSESQSMPPIYLSTDQSRSRSSLALYQPWIFPRRNTRSPFAYQTKCHNNILPTLFKCCSLPQRGPIESNVGMILAESLPAGSRIMAVVDLSLMVRLWSMPLSEYWKLGDSIKLLIQSLKTS